MEFNYPAGKNPIDQLKVVGKATDRLDGPVKTTGVAPYAYEQLAFGKTPVYGEIVGAAIAKGYIKSINLKKAKAAPGVIAIITAENAGTVNTGEFYAARQLAGPKVEHYHQAVAVVVAETFEQARAAAALVEVTYTEGEGKFDLAASMSEGVVPKGSPDQAIGNFETEFAASPVKIDQEYTTPDQTHAMMEPHATVAEWQGDKLTLWTSVQIIKWASRDLSKILGIPAENIRFISPFIGGGFGGKATVLSDAVLAALAARVARVPVKVTLARPIMTNNTTHRPATIQRVRLGANPNGKLTAIAHESWSGNIAGGMAERSTVPSVSLYAAAHRLFKLRLSVLDLPEGSAMRAPGETPGLMALEVAMDELAEKLQLDPVELRIINDTQTDPVKPERHFSTRRFKQCLETGAKQFGWKKRNAIPGSVRDGRWLIGMGVAGAIRGDNVDTSAARVRLTPAGVVIVETDMTDIGTGSYTIIGQTAAEMMGVPIERVIVRLGDSAYPQATGSLGQRGANSSTSGVYAACVKLRETVIQKLGFNNSDAVFENEKVRSGKKTASLKDAAADGELMAEDKIEFGKGRDVLAHQTFGAHFCEVAVDSATGEVRLRRMLAVCDCGRILNPKTARSQVIGAMTMGAGGALMEELIVDKKVGYFVNHDLASYEVPTHADIPHQEVIFLNETDPGSSPMKAKGVGELGICGVGAAIANAVYNATGVRVRDYPITLDKLLDKLPAV
jgi:xanthine dehydrogenase YagR molybdenum-binding subunit